MTANKNLLRIKFSHVVEAYAKHTGCSLDDALKKFYGSQTYAMMRDGVADMHCMSILYLVDELASEQYAAYRGFRRTSFGLLVVRIGDYDA